MTSADTQWPRYQVFHQEATDRPHINSGSVHATDAELALQNARDVFARRPDCVSLWVVPASEIHSLTADEIERTGHPKRIASERAEETYQVFWYEMQNGSHAHIGSVQANSPENALATALDELGKGDGLVWWVVPETAIARTDPEEIESLFHSAADKPYRTSAFYHTVTLMRRLRQQKGAGE